jgi:hypothetical protein
MCAHYSRSAKSSSGLLLVLGGPGYTLIGDALDPGVICLKVGYSVPVAYLSFHHSLERPARDIVLEVLHTFSGNGLQFAVL